MMDIYKYTSLELSRKLKEAGAKQESELRWMKVANNQYGLARGLYELEDPCAFDCYELLESLPKAFDVSSPLQMLTNIERETVLFGYGGYIWMEDKNPTEALGKLKLWCLEHGYDKPGNEDVQDAIAGDAQVINRAAQVINMALTSVALKDWLSEWGFHLSPPAIKYMERIITAMEGHSK